MRRLVLFLPLMCVMQLWAVDFKLTTKAVGDIVLKCPNPGSWKIASSVESADGKEYLLVSMDTDEPAVPAQFEFEFTFPQRDIHHLWQGGDDRCQLRPDWGAWYTSALAQRMPLYAFINENNQNRLTISCSESQREVQARLGLREEGSVIYGWMGFFRQAEAPMQHYKLSVMLDATDRFWADAVREGAEWMTRVAEYEPCPVPEAAYEPLYSTWYQFHQNVTDKAIEQECALASKMGMKTLIVDDGWQTDDNNRGYAYTGDWEVSPRRFPDMAAHVKRVQQMGMKYMMWYAVPHVGMKSKNYARFKDKALWHTSDAAILDPRFPEVREFLCGLYEKALKDWNLDGFKLDFIDNFTNGSRRDPAIDQNYAGRDIKSVPESVDVLMKEVRRRLQAIKPDILIEFRQAYFGPAIRQYGNMMRAGDCPGDLQANRIRTSNLRLTSGNTAVHADMLEWHPTDTPEHAARPILAVLYTTIQYSMMLRDLPESHTRVIQHWLDFSQQHRNTLLHGTFRPYHPEAGYPVLEAESADERILTAYQDDVVVTTGKADRTIYLVNASGKDGVVAELQKKPRKVTMYNVYGEQIKTATPQAGITRLPIPQSGYIRLEF